jgi:hypothetical protein
MGRWNETGLGLAVIFFRGYLTHLACSPPFARFGVCATEALPKQSPALSYPQQLSQVALAMAVLSQKLGRSPDLISRSGLWTKLWIWVTNLGATCFVSRRNQLLQHSISWILGYPGFCRGKPLGARLRSDG